MKHYPFLLLIFCITLCGAQDEKNEFLKLNAELYIFGDSTWEFSIVEFDDYSGAELIYSYERYIHSSKINGSSILEEQQVQSLKNALVSNGFYELPNDIESEAYAFHTPQYSIKVCYSNKCHSVSLDEQGDRIVLIPEDRKDFLFIWDYIINLLPIYDLPEQWPVSKNYSLRD